MPRGPVTVEEALVLLGACLLLGILAGWVAGSGWTALAGPAVFLLILELVRPDLAGPTVGALRLDETYGILAFLLGRVLPGILVLLPMTLGVRLGLILRKVSLDAPAGASILDGQGAVGTGMLLFIVVGLMVWLLIPARTPDLVDDSGQPIQGSIASLEEISLGGQQQSIMIRAENPENPVLLYLSGGPGQSDLGYTRVLFRDIAADFVVVSWDQRGVGKSYPALDPARNLTFEQAVADTIELTEYLRDRFDEQKIYLLGESYGTILGVSAVQERPDLYYAWIGSGQMVDITETDRRLYQEMLDYADQTGDEPLRQQMEAYGEPPYEDIPYANAAVMGYYEALYDPYTPPRQYIELGRKARLGFMNINSQEYNLIEKINVLRGLVDVFSILYPQLEEIDLRRDAAEMEVPVYLLDGRAEVDARRDLTLEWFEILDAPGKWIYSFDNAAHSVAFEQFQELHRIMLEEVLPDTYPG
jgi:pimeloyl-ACP methyl ester carboxylesterase